MSKYIMLRDEGYSYDGCRTTPYKKGEILEDPQERLIKCFCYDMRPPAMRPISKEEEQEAMTNAMDQNPGMEIETQDLQFETKEKPKKGRGKKGLI
jgi:hypothetical protein